MGNIRFATIAMTGLLALAPFAASAYTGPCQMEMDAVQYRIETAQYLGNKAASDKANLLLKFDAAGLKITARKYDDAIGKLMDIASTTKAMADATKEKMSDADAAAIATAVNGAILCIGGL